MLTTLIVAPVTVKRAVQTAGFTRRYALLGAVKTAGVAQRSCTGSSAQSKAGVARSCYIPSAMALLEYWQLWSGDDTVPNVISC